MKRRILIVVATIVIFVVLFVLINSKSLVNTSEPYNTDVVMQNSNNIELTTHMSKFGIEITYPVSWDITEDTFTTVGQVSEKKDRIVLVPDTTKPDFEVKPYLVITIKDTTEEIPIPDESLHEEYIIINGVRGIYSPGANGIDTYYFYKGERIFTIETVHVLKNLMTENEIKSNEILKAVSTFKIINS